MKENLLRIKPSVWVLIAIMLIAVFFGLNLLNYKSPKTILVPGIACGLIIILGAMQFRRELRAGIMTPSGEPEVAQKEVESEDLDEIDAAPSQDNSAYFSGFLWLLGFTLVIYLVGFIYATFLFITLFTRFNSKHNWILSGIIGVVGAAVFWLAFVYFLQSDLWSGAVFQWFNLSHLTLSAK
jgi:hypothetical protein